MTLTKWWRFLAAGTLLISGILVVRAARAGNGDCPTTHLAYNCSNIPWGSTCRPATGSFIQTGTSNGTQVMYVNWAGGTGNFSCLEGIGVTGNGTILCRNHDSTADGASVSDVSGDCNGSVAAVGLWGYN
jgi:hypothetical protein